MLIGTRRRQLLKELEGVAVGAAPVALSSECKAICFQIMYGLPCELQIRAACSLCERYLPTFQAKWPHVIWPRQLLGDVDGWHRAKGRGTPDAPEEADSADSAYLFCFDFLLSAYHHKDDPASLTAGTCGAMGYAAYASADHAWLADDPEAARLEREKDAYYRIEEDRRPSEAPSFRKLDEPAHSPYHNVAFITVYRQEWAHVPAWLRAEAVWQYPEPNDLDSMMQGLQRWEAHQFLPMGPPRADPKKKTKRRT